MRRPARSTLLEQRRGRARVVQLGKVVGDVRDEAHRVVTGLAQPDLQQGLGAGRDPELAAPRALAGEQVGVVRMVSDRDRPRVRHRHRDRPHADDPGHAEPVDHVHDGTGEGLPAVVRLGAVQQEVRRPAGVPQQPHDQPRRVVGLVVVADEGHRRPSGPVVVELVDVERGHDRSVGEADQVPDGDRGGVACVEEPVEDQHHGQRRGVVQLGHVVDDVHETGFLGHAGRPSGRGWCPAQRRRRPHYSPRGSNPRLG